jgi:5S rRNA maturation endonuclease (ribonuclease M5)
MPTQPSNEDVLALIEQKKDLLTICEGKNDRAALHKLGFTNVMTLEKAALYQVVERVDKGARIQLLVDLDAHGRELYSRLNSDFRQRGVFIDNELREVLFRTPVRQIEDLAKYLSTVL